MIAIMMTKSLLSLSEAGEWSEARSSTSTTQSDVVLTGVQMSFGSMVSLALKWVLALLVAVGILGAVLGAVYLGAIRVLGTIG